MLTLEDSPAEAEFRAEVRTWAHGLPDDLKWTDDHDRLLTVDRLLARDGLLGISWPVEYGGRGAPAILEAVLTEELGAVGVRRSMSPSHQGVNNLAPALMAHASKQQKAAHLPKILAVEELWCQGFSEPDAGSDLANVRTTAVVDGSQLVINGSKLWTSGAQHADWIYLLLRTGAVEDRHKSLSFVLVPMDTPGITVQPIEKITGASEFCEVFFDDVVAAVDGLVGEFGEGWRVAMTLLSSERLSGRYRFATFRHELEQLLDQLTSGGARPLPEPLAREFGSLVAEIDGMGALSMRVDSLTQAGKDVGVLPSVNKLWWPRAHQRVMDFALRAAAEVRTDLSRWYFGWLESRAESIYGGSAQVQRNIMSERGLGMPRGR